MKTQIIGSETVGNHSGVTLDFLGRGSTSTDLTRSVEVARARIPGIAK